MPTPTRRSRGMARKEREKFRLLVLGHIATLSRPARFQKYSSCDHEIDTPLGPLGVSLSIDGDIACAHGRFEYPRVAAAVLGRDRVNEHSGKWNFYYGKGCTGEDAFLDWKSRLDVVMRVTWAMNPPGVNS